MKKKVKFIIAGIIVLLIIAGVIYTNMSSSNRVLMKTSKGEIVIELNPAKAPVTVKNFLSYVDDGSYEGTVFHRVIDGFMIQGGGFDEKGEQRDTREPIEIESDNGLKNEEGSIAMARTSDPNSATNQFFINTADNNFLDYGYRDEGYAVFGKVVSGMDVVKKIESVKTGTKNGMGDWPVEDVKIISVERM